MKVVFLDFDGVMNTNAWLFRDTPETEKWADLDPTLVARVRRIVEATDARIVISSSWRNYYDLETLSYFLMKAGWPDAPIIDRTPCLFSRPRGHEVQLWLEKNTALQVEKYVVLDDWNEFHFTQNHIRTNEDVGLTEQDVENAIILLGGRVNTPIDSGQVT